MIIKMRRRAVRSLLLGAAASLVLAGAASAQTHAFNIPAQDAVTALQAFAQQSGKQVLFPFDAAAGHRTPAISGSLTDARALQILLDAAGLSIVHDDGRTVTLRARRRGDEASAEDAAVAVGEVVVTGSHIRGVPPIAPVQVVTRDDIDVSGYSKVTDVILSLPSVFGGGQNPTAQNTGTAGSGGVNFTNASTVNLHGLGADATLTLLNGHRLAADGSYQAPDVSVIPLAAIDHIDVITDGASALYGSDAVGGVVNFVLRKNYNGAEISSTLGAATEGGGFEQDYNLLAGKTWSTGHVLASVEYAQQDPILTTERSFTSNPPLISSLLQESAHDSLFFSGEQSLNEWTTFQIDALYSRRQAHGLSQYSIGTPLDYESVPTWLYQIDPSVSFKLPANWSLSIDGSISTSGDVLNQYFYGGNYDLDYGNATRSIEINASGSAFRLPSGDVKVALGAGYRTESFFFFQSSPGTTQNQTDARDERYIYGEVFAPLVSPSPDRIGLEKLDLSLAGRVESYSDVGTSANPKVALKYQPIAGLSLRGTWGTSFKAPTFYQLSQPRTAELYLASQLGSNMPGYGLFDYGGSSNLKPERATSWTAGIDYSPPSLQFFDISATYFNIEYKDRIVYPISDFGEALSNPSFAPFVTKNATPQQVSALNAAVSMFYNESGGTYDTTLPTSIIEDVYTNAARQSIKGVDLSIKDGFALPRGDAKLFLSATWLDISQQTLPNEPAMTLTGTVFSPSTFRLRSGLSWIYQGLTATGIVNYVSGETDNSVIPSRPVSSWTTVDMTIDYRLPVREGLFSGIETSLAITNLLDKAPPYVAGAAIGTPGVYFDSTNTSPIGRFVALTVRKRF